MNGGRRPAVRPGNLVLDLDGVVYVGDRTVPGSGAALSRIEDMGIRMVFATNASTRTPAATAERIRRITGYPARPEMVVTSGLAAATLVGDADVPILACGEPGLGETLREVGLATTEDPPSARCVMIGLDRSFTYARLKAATDAVRGGARLIATNADATFPADNGPEPGAGALLAAVERASGVRAEVAGKPHDPMLRTVGSKLGPGAAWVIGDNPDTDLALGAAAGWHTVLVLTGVTTDPHGISPELAPAAVLSSVSELPDLLAQMP